MNSVNKLLEKSFKSNWDRPAISNYRGATITYGQLSYNIVATHIMFEKCGIKPGDKISICSKNQANWGVAFLASLTYGAVPVPILNEFKSGTIHHLVNHSNSRLLYVGEAIWENLSPSEMPEVEAIAQMENFSVLYAKDSELKRDRLNIDAIMQERYGDSFGPDSLCFYEDSPEELALINYTSGTSGFSKGVMIPYRALYSNIKFGSYAMPSLNNRSRVVSMLPTAHMYGLMFEFLFEMTIGACTYFLTRLPSPRILMEAFSEIKPNVIISVPMIIEKIYKNKLIPIISKKRIKMFLNLPGLDKVVKKKIKDELISAFGGEFEQVIIGGAAFNREAEVFFKRIKFPFTVGYGMTECAPIITYVPHNKTRLYSCGVAAPRMQIRIDSPDERRIPGEILVKGDNVFLGYYRNKEATDAVFTEDGWFRTGDVGVLDNRGYLYLKGRNKSMILGPSGQNIYPEEIESGINNLPYVAESLVVDEKGQLIALVYPDLDLIEKEGLSQEDVLEKIKEGINIVNMELPVFCQVKNVELIPEEFEKTPKRSIKRYLYQRNNL